MRVVGRWPGNDWASPRTWRRRPASDWASAYMRSSSHGADACGPRNPASRLANARAPAPGQFQEAGLEKRAEGFGLDAAVAFELERIALAIVEDQERIRGEQV